MQCRLFVEVLSNIGVVQIHTNGEIVSINASNSYTKDIGDQIVIKYEGHMSTYDLPFPVVINTSLEEMLVDKPATLRCKTATNRLVKPQIDELILMRDPYSKEKLAKLLKEETETFLSAMCKFCSAELFRIDKNFPKLLELPDENWREMMELWHCHKPEVKDGNADTMALDHMFSSKILPRYDNILINETYFLLNSSLFSKEPTLSGDAVRCYSCGNILGLVYNKTEDLTACKISKDSLKICSSTTQLQENYTQYDTLALTMLKSIKDFGSRFFTLVSSNENASKSVLLLWCLDYGISICLNDKKLDNRLKVMFKKIDLNNPEQKSILDGLKSKHNVEEIVVEDENVSKLGGITEYIDNFHNEVTFSDTAALTNGWKLSYI